MKTKLIALVVLCGLSTGAFGGPLQQKDVAAEAKWVVHLDVDRFKQTGFGKLLGQQLDTQLAKPVANLKRDLDFDFDWRRIRSITAYGTDLKKRPEANAVLIIKSDLDVQTALDTAADRLAAVGAEESKSLRRIGGTNGDLYALGKQGYAALLPANTLIVARTRERAEEAARVMRGKSDSIGSTGKLAGSPADAGQFLLLGITEPIADEFNLPKQAAALQQISGALLSLGEQGEKLAATLTLGANSEETATQLQQVAQGLVALAGLSQPDNKELQQLAQSAKVSASDQMVTVAVQYPAEKLADELLKRAAKKRRQ
jgi:hypothetical protein